MSASRVSLALALLEAGLSAAAFGLSEPALGFAAEDPGLSAAVPALGLSAAVPALGLSAELFFGLSLVFKATASYHAPGRKTRI